MFDTHTLTETELIKWKQHKEEIKARFSFTIVTINDWGYDCLVNGKVYGGETKGDAYRLALHDILSNY